MDLMAAQDRPAPSRAYLLDNRAPEAEQRFDSLSALFNPGTFRHMEQLGIAPGWHCWEVGVGGPSIPTWLAGRVGPSGRVLATDIDIRWAEGAQQANVEILRHDVVHDDPPAGGFDLVHERLVLIHLAEREQALTHMVAALRPGGWLLVEDFDPTMQPDACPDETGPEQRLANKMRRGLREMLAARGADLMLGRRLPRLLRDAGLEDVAADAYLSLALPAAVRMEQANVLQLRGDYVRLGHASESEVDQHLDALAAGRLDVASAPLISAWGRKPIPT
jgi:SAM-dependent methyltransferase